jgi:mRNA (guanine-N7-)-methyltransferase
MLSDDLVKLDINDLMDCLNEQPVKLQKDFKTFVDRTVQERRQSSSIIALRDLHNWVKRTLITNTVGLLKQKNTSLLDIAAGRGGDIDKWNKSGIKNVFGFDVSPESISSNDPFNPGAEQRLQNYARGSTNIHFEVGDAIHPTGALLDSIENFIKKNEIPGFGMVSCQFALHYFFGSKTDLDTAIKIASKYLKPGGYLIFTTMDSKKIRSFFTSRKSKVYDRPLFNIQIDKYFKKEPYGNKYTFTIKDTFDQGNYFNTMGPSEEYLVDLDELNTVCQQNGLVPFNKNLLESYSSNGKTEYTNMPSNVIPFESIVRLWKPKEKSRSITPEELELNSLYISIVFQKRV